MRILLDTHVYLWAVTDSPRLSAAMRECIGHAEAVFLSAASVWEIAIKVRPGEAAGRHRCPCCRCRSQWFPAPSGHRAACSRSSAFAALARRPIRPPASRPGHRRAAPPADSRWAAGGLRADGDAALSLAVKGPNARCAWRGRSLHVRRHPFSTEQPAHACRLTTRAAEPMAALEAIEAELPAISGLSPAR
jgi:hypothetical protein